jgi:hypothetical protein
MKKIIFSFVLICAVSSAYSQLQYKSGLILDWGKYSIHDFGFTTAADVALFYSDAQKYNATVGYKLRLQPAAKRFFVDVDAKLGYKKVKFAYYADYWFSSASMPSFISTYNYIQLSVNPTFNYTIYDGWYAGVGIEPTVYSVSEADQRNDFFKFDMPLTARFGYDFKYMDLSFSYNYGLSKALDPKYFSQGTYRTWQIQLFIPF